ncbi:PAS domain-containing protein [Maribacter antarcticus]|uniref:PAS domain-containing protein n=1 Tax=Maribacter antarcticus TaxID=505250 RepID=UPI00068757CA|nr:PAS domain-containing protein [Maribacter antarcticus]
MKSIKKPTYQELEERINQLQSEIKIDQDYKRLFDNATISIWNEDFTLIFEQIDKLRKLDIPNIKIYLKKNPKVLFSFIGKLKINSVNKATLQLFGAKSDEEFLNNIQITFGDGADKVFLSLIESIWNNEKSFISEVNYKTLQGDEFAALFSIHIPQTKKEQQSVPVTIQSIQAVKEAEAAKRESLIKLEQAQKIANIGSWEWEWETDNAVWSDEMYRIYGVKKDEFDPISENVSKTILEEDKQKMEHAISQLLKGEIVDSFEFKIVRPNNEIRDLIIIGLQINKGTIFGVTQDITDRKKIENELNKAQTLAKVGSWIFNLSNQKIKWSNEMFHMWGLNPKKDAPLEFDTMLKQIHIDDLKLLTRSVEKASTLGTPYDIEHRVLLTNGEQKVLRAICQPVLGATGEVVGLVGTSQDITVQKLLGAELITAKEKAEESKDYLNNIINNIGDPVFVKDDKLRLVLVNDSFCKLLGVSKSKIIGTTMAENFPDQQMEGFLKIDRQVLSDGQEILKEETVTNASGDELTIITRKSRYVDEHNNKFIVGTIRDITEAQIIQKELNSQNKKIYNLNTKLNEAQRLSHIGNWEYNIETDTITWSKELFNIFERSYELEAPKYSEHELFYTKESFEIMNQAFINCIQNKVPYDIELDIYTSNGSIKHIISKGNFKKNDDNKVVSCYGTAQDITQRKLIQKELDSQNEKLNNVNNTLNEAQKLAHIGSWLFNLTTQKIEWSDETFHIWGLDPKKDAPPEFDTMLKQIHTDDLELFTRSIEKASTLGTPYDIEHRVLLTNGEQKVLRAICQPILGATGEVVSLAGTSQDITEQKKLAIELIKAKEKAEESDRLKSAFLANMSHELRTPMNGILGFSELLKEKNISNEKKDTYLEFIEKEGNRLLSFISNIVDISKIESNVITINTSSSNINILIDELYSKYAIKLKNTGIKLQIKKGLGDKDSSVKIDTNKLVQVLSNLLENAIKFTKKGEIEFGYFLANSELKFYVKDSGVGIEIEEQRNIFNRFRQGKLEQTHNHGVGLGLSIVKGLVNILGGDVWVDSQTGVGSTFFFTIPYENVTTDTKVVLDHSDTALESGHFTLLIAEDDEFSFMYLKACLSDFNCSILRAFNGKEAVELVNQNAAIDLVLMDINMPEMNGDRALEEIRKTNKEVPIIAQTGLAMSGDKEKLLKAGFNDYISKPISTNVLMTTVNKHLKKVASAKNS